MNILKHMEAIFVATVATAVLAVSGAYALDSVPDAQAGASVVAGANASKAAMPVVVISAKRMTADEKLQSLREERKLATARTTQWDRT